MWHDSHLILWRDSHLFLWFLILETRFYFSIIYFILFYFFWLVMTFLTLQRNPEMYENIWKKKFASQFNFILEKKKKETQSKSKTNLNKKRVILIIILILIWLPIANFPFSKFLFPKNLFLKILIWTLTHAYQPCL